MTKSKEVIQTIIKTERRISKDGNGYTEQTVNVSGTDLKQVHKIFKEEWNES